MKNRISSAGIDVDSELKVEVPMSSPDNGNTHVMCRIFKVAGFIDSKDFDPNTVKYEFIDL